MGVKMKSKRGLVLAAGGVRVAYHAGFLYVLDRMGYKPHHVIGVSAGAIAGGAWAVGRLDNMISILSTLEEKRVHKKTRKSLVAWRLARNFLGRYKMQSVYDNSPMADLIIDFFKGAQVLEGIAFRAGRVNLEDGTYTSETDRDGLRLAFQILASASIPVLWPPVRDDGRKAGAWVDGGVRNALPLGDLLDDAGEDLNEVLAVMTESDRFKGGPAARIEQLALTSASVMVKEVLVNDLSQWLFINNLLEQAGNKKLKHPTKDRLLHAVDLDVSFPSEGLGSGRDFSNKNFRRLMKLGEKDALRYTYGNAIPADYKTLDYLFR